MSTVSSKQSTELQQHLFNDLRWHCASDLSLTRSPIQTLDLISENHTDHRQTFWKSNLERVAFHLVCYGAKERQPHFLVISSGGDD